MRKFLLFVLLMIAGLVSRATHIRAGEISYRWLSGYTYEVTIVIYSKTSSDIEDAVLKDVNWGDGKVETIPRTSNVPVGVNTSKRTYVRQHTYPGPGRYNISLTHKNRNDGILNIGFGNSVDAAFYLETELIANPFSPVNGYVINNSPILMNPPLDDACLFAIFEHNPAAYDPDGDYLTYKLIACRGEDGQPLEYVFPNMINPGIDNQITIDANSGDLVWDVPKAAGEYNVAILIEEWRNGIKVGSLVRDMQINVVPNCNNRRPLISNKNDVCLEAGEVYKDSIQASDPDNGHKVILSALGGPFQLANNPATFSQPDTSNPATGYLEWRTTCQHIRKEPYEAVIKAQDLAANPLVDFESFTIKVVGPKPKDPSAIPLESSILVSWTPSICPNVARYDIYRRGDPFAYNPGRCETGIPGWTGYTRIGSVNGAASNSFVDSSAILKYKTEFCYRIVAVFPDSAESYVSEETCTFARRDFPQMTKVSVGTTDIGKGVDTVSWVYPILLDSTVQFRGPYHYKVYREDGIKPVGGTLVHETPLSSSLALTDTVFLDSNINTVSLPHTYRVELWSNGQYTGSSSSSSSVYLQVAGTDKKNILTWRSEVSWVNTTTDIYRMDLTTGLFVLLAQTPDMNPFDTLLGQYEDTTVVNGQEYCYYVVTYGNYLNLTIKRPLINYSQRVCATPVDTLGPCIDRYALKTASNCDSAVVHFSWDTVLYNCSSDLKHYTLYYSPVAGGPLSPYKTFPKGTGRYDFSNEGSIAGCFALSSTDSLGNESRLTDTVCVDNCPDYKLPNVFSPNNDGINDKFHPFPYRFIESVDAKIYNRWGKLLFSTTDPDISWDGTAGGKPVADGVYFYVVVVKKITFKGIVEEVLRGTVTVFTNKEEK